LFCVFCVNLGVLERLFLCLPDLVAIYCQKQPGMEFLLQNGFKNAKPHRCQFWDMEVDMPAVPCSAHSLIGFDSSYVPGELLHWPWLYLCCKCGHHRLLLFSFSLSVTELRRNCLVIQEFLANELDFSRKTFHSLSCKWRQRVITKQSRQWSLVMNNVLWCNWMKNCYPRCDTVLNQSRDILRYAALFCWLLITGCHCYCEFLKLLLLELLQ